MIYTIPKGFHYSYAGMRPLPHIGRREWHYKVRFLHTCIYDLGTADQSDWNKLGGFGFGWGLHKDSARWGWRWNMKTDLIELANYTYVDQVRSFPEEPICFARIEEWKELRIVKGEFHYHFFSDGCKAVDVFHKRDLPFLGMNAYPYFGGNRPAPHTMQIETIRI